MKTRLSERVTEIPRLCAMALSKRTLRSFIIALVAFLCRGMGWEGGEGDKKRSGYNQCWKMVWLSSVRNWGHNFRELQIVGDNTDLELQSMIIKPARVCLGANFSLEHHCDMLPQSREGYSSDASSLKDWH